VDRGRDGKGFEICGIKDANAGEERESEFSKQKGAAIITD